MNDTYGNVQTFEYISVGKDISTLLDQIIPKNILAHGFVIRGFKGRTIAMYLKWKVWNPDRYNIINKLILFLESMLQWNIRVLSYVPVDRYGHQSEYWGCNWQIGNEVVYCAISGAKYPISEFKKYYIHEVLYNTHFFNIKENS